MVKKRISDFNKIEYLANGVVNSDEDLKVPTCARKPDDVDFGSDRRFWTEEKN
jgi:hypothetical protein